MREQVFTPPPHPATLSVELLLRSCQWGRERTGGPGGQHRNKVESGVWITHMPTGIEASAGERRSAEDNKKVAVTRLRRALAVDVRCPVPSGEIRSTLWLSRCTPQGTLVCNSDHHDYPSLLAEAIDVIAAANWDPKRASIRLCCTLSQIIKLLKEHPPAAVRLNYEREQRGLHAIK